MTDIALRVENLSKSYRIGLAEQRATSVGQVVRQVMGRPFRYLNQVLRKPSDAEILWALKDVTFEVPRGEVVAIIGRNGAGKSTLFKILSRITEPTHGYVEIHGRVSSLLEVGTGFNYELTGRENIYLNGTILGMKKREIDRRLDEIIDFAGVEKFIDTPVKRYSSGMNVRLAFAVAAHLEPEVLILDEVLAVGDTGFQKKCISKIKTFTSRKERTILIVSHTMSTVAELATRCIYLNQGQLIANGSPYEVIEQYLQQQQTNTLEENVTHALREWLIPGQSLRWQFTHVRIISTEPHVIAFQPLEIEVEYISYELFEEMRISLGIANFLGTRLISFRTDEGGKTFQTRAGERGKIRFLLEPSYLSSGRYVLQLGAGNDHNAENPLDYLNHALEFHVVPTPSDAWGLQRMGLGVRLPFTWTIEPLNYT
ncbi:MAG: ABC transporter ATP-binding protein [Leptolyngbyaceae cyanobacterium bins.59]|nr:ABC transporter ATP-binding protein [Leptolyngbyaceae cyanobacterium bins.59]